MHDTAQANAERFFKTYINPNEYHTIIDIGSRNYGGSFHIGLLKTEKTKYIGLDFQYGQNVNTILEDPYVLPFEENTIDYAVSSSCFEHSEFFWLTYLEVMRVLKPGGLFYMNVPSNGAFHRFPVDCWRFYPDSATALVNWGKRNGLKNALIEQYTSYRENDIWEDYVAIFIKNENLLSQFQSRIIDTFGNFKNGSVYPHDTIINNTEFSY